MRAYLFAIAGIAVLTAGAMGFLYVATEDGAGARSTPVVPVEPPPLQELPPPPVLERPRVDLGVQIAPPSPGEVSPARPKPEAGTWAAVPLAARAAKLGRTGGSLAQGLSEITPLLSACFGSVVQKMDDSNELPTLELRIETRTGEVFIADALPSSTAGAPDELFACAIGAVKGRTFPASGTKAGQRLRMLLPISP